MTPRIFVLHSRIKATSEKLPENAMRHLGLSARAYDRFLK